MEKKIKDAVRTYIVENFLFGIEPESFSENDSFIERGIIDSTGILELSEFIEQKFMIRIEDTELMPENLDSINRVSIFVTRKLADAN